MSQIVVEVLLNWNGHDSSGTSKELALLVEKRLQYLSTYLDSRKISILPGLTEFPDDPLKLCNVEIHIADENLILSSHEQSSLYFLFTKEL